MRTSFRFISIISFLMSNLHAEVTSSALSQDMPLIKNVTKELLGSKVKYKLIFNDSDQAGVEPKGKNKFIITIGSKAYDQYGAGEGALALICHELGHAAAGTKDFVSQEEDADYWATKECMPKILKLFPNKTSSVVSPFDDAFKKACEKNSNKEDQEICFRSLRGAYFFRNDMYKDFCNTQKLYFKISESELSKTPYKGKRPPNISQCSFNNLVAGALKLKQPTCYNLMLIGPSLFGENCSPGSYSSMPQELGVEEDLPTEETSISNVSRSSQVIKNDEVIFKNIKSQVVPK